MIFVYILRSLKDEKYYIGQTNDSDRRLQKHNEGKIKSTKNRKPLKLVYSEKFNNRSEAMKREKQLKSYKSHKYIDWLIKNKGLVV